MKKSQESYTSSIRSNIQIPLGNKEVLQKIDQEVSLSDNLSFYARLNINLGIDYINQSFCESLGVPAYELVGKNFLELLHPEMPLAIKDLIRKGLQKGKSMQVLEKYPSEQGNYFWLMSTYTIRVDTSGNITSIQWESQKASRFIVAKLQGLYQLLRKIEIKTSGVAKSSVYFQGFLEEREMSYELFIASLIQQSEQYSYVEQFQAAINRQIRQTTAKKYQQRQESQRNQILRSIRKGA